MSFSGWYLYFISGQDELVALSPRPIAAVLTIPAAVLNPVDLIPSAHAAPSVRTHGVRFYLLLMVAPPPEDSPIE
jgi:hypothetical protein